MVYKLAIASMSLGRAWAHSIPTKFTAAAAAGIPGIEIFYEDLLYQAQALPGGAIPSNLILASHQIRAICDSLSLQIMGIGPFYGYEGILDPTIRAEKLQELKLWFRIARILGTDIIQIPSTFMTTGVTGSKEHIVRDFKEVAEMGMQENPPIRFAYENLCFGTFNDTWSKAWSIVEAVDYPNFGMCLDTFNIAGREYADPSSPIGTVPNASVVFAASLKEMAQTIDVKKVFYVQIVDAERLASPLVKGHEFYVEGQKARMSWSRNCRLFMCEEDRGGYLPVMDVLRAICDGIGYEGWISIELFNRSLVEEGEEVPKEHAARAVQSWQKVVKAMGWEGKTEEIVATAQVAGAAFGTRRDVERKAEETLARL